MSIMAAPAVRAVCPRAWARAGRSDKEAGREAADVTGKVLALCAHGRSPWKGARGMRWPLSIGIRQVMGECNRISRFPRPVGGAGGKKNTSFPRRLVHTIQGCMKKEKRGKWRALTSCHTSYSPDAWRVRPLKRNGFSLFYLPKLEGWRKEPLEQLHSVTISAHCA
jgi:hypothetical protein